MPMKTTVWITLGCIVLNSLILVSPVTAGPQSDQAQRVARIKEKVTEYRDKGKVITVKTKSGKKLKGIVVEIVDDSFTIRDISASTTQAIACSEVAEIKGKGLSTFAKIGIAWMAVGLVLTLVGANR